MTRKSRRLAGILLIVFPSVIFGGVSLLTLLIGDARYMENPLRQNLWRAGHDEPLLLRPLQHVKDVSVAAFGVTEYVNLLQSLSRSIADGSARMVQKRFRARL
jgi:hypothetical protein